MIAPSTFRLSTAILVCTPITTACMEGIVLRLHVPSRLRQRQAHVPGRRHRTLSPPWDATTARSDSSVLGKVYHFCTVRIYQGRRTALCSAPPRTPHTRDGLKKANHSKG
jgi:hypothetical protein